MPDEPTEEKVNLSASWPVRLPDYMQAKVKEIARKRFNTHQGIIRLAVARLIEVEEREGVLKPENEGLQDTELALLR